MTTKKPKPNPYAAVLEANLAGQTEESIETAQDAMPESAPERKGTSAQSMVARKSSGQRLRVDLVRKMKVFAAQEGRHDYEVMEEAIEEFLAKRNAL